ncbi:MAG: MOSC domain-containing protein [Candidatus Binataceae bacterium]
MRRHVGIVSALWRYPVKSMRGEKLTSAVIAQNGINGDRVWAPRELKYGGIMSARTWAGLLALAARHETSASSSDAKVVIDFPDGTTVGADESRASELLSRWLAREVRLECVTTTRPSPAEMEAIARGEMFPPSRDFFDEDVMHVLATSTLAHLRRVREGADFDTRRFRANLYVDTRSDTDGFVEDEWLGGVLEIGDEVKLAGLRPALRCAMITHPQSELPHDPSILRTTWEHHQAYVGVFAFVAASGTVHTGDPVVLAV